jgi:glutaredoxin
VLKDPSSDLERWKELLFLKFKNKNDILNKINYYFKGKLLLYSKDNCVYCKLLKNLLKECKISYTEIEPEEASMYMDITDTKEYSTVPQLFVDFDNEITFLGGYNNSWEFLKPLIDYQELYNLSYELMINLNRVIDINYYPTKETKTSNMRHRPTGLGVQGLGDLFLKLKLPFDSEESRQINKNIFETIYFGAMNSSLDLSKIHGPYETFKGSHLSNGKFNLTYGIWIELNYQDYGIGINYKMMSLNSEFVIVY